MVPVDGEAKPPMRYEIILILVLLALAVVSVAGHLWSATG